MNRGKRKNGQFATKQSLGDISVSLLQMSMGITTASFVAWNCLLKDMV
tara:strand:+ start:13833 stop:13976 length:144 start_codon:yes stop_codon:yes gene_type:complete